MKVQEDLREKHDKDDFDDARDAIDACDIKVEKRKGERIMRRECETIGHSTYSQLYTDCIHEHQDETNDC